MKRNKGRRGDAGLGVVACLLILAVPRRLGAQASAASFDGPRAFADLKHLVDYGPRPAGSAALAQARTWMVEQLKATGAQVEEDQFTPSTPNGPIPMTNLIAKFPGAQSKVVMLAGHYDTKLYPNDKKSFRFVGANDGGSSAALLLELARELSGRKHELTYWLAFFDGEEAVSEDWTDADSVYGSRHLVQKLSSTGELGRIKAMILVDMIGDSHLVINRDQASTKWLTDVLFNAAHRMGYTRYFPDAPTAVDDDHIPFVNAGVAAVDIIDFDPSDGYWHTPKDTLDHCSPQSLTIVGRVVLAALDDLEKSPHVK